MTRQFFRQLKREPDAGRRLAMLDAMLAATGKPRPDLRHLTDPLEQGIAMLLWSNRNDPEYVSRFLAATRDRYGEQCAHEHAAIIERLRRDALFAREQE